MADSHKAEDWWDEHPFFKKFYVPLVLTATFIIQIVEVFKGSRGK